MFSFFHLPAVVVVGGVIWGVGKKGRVLEPDGWSGTIRDEAGITGAKKSCGRWCFGLFEEDPSVSQLVLRSAALGNVATSCASIERGGGVKQIRRRAILPDVGQSRKGDAITLPRGVTRSKNDGHTTAPPVATILLSLAGPADTWRYGDEGEAADTAERARCAFALSRFEIQALRVRAPAGQNSFSLGVSRDILLSS